MLGTSKETGSQLRASSAVFRKALIYRALTLRLGLLEADRSTLLFTSDAKLRRRRCNGSN